MRLPDARVLRFSLQLLVWLLSCGLASSGFAGPNAGGTLITFNPHIPVAATEGTSVTCASGQIPTACPDSAGSCRTDNPGGYGDFRIWKIYAAFPESSSPRLMGLTYGLSYDESKVWLYQANTCADFELPDTGWPGPGTGNSITWNTPATGHLVPLAWFYAGVYAPSQIVVGPNLNQGGWFGDDSIPAVLDPITGYGAMGFNMDGWPACPGSAPLGACCLTDSTCVLTMALGCPPPYRWTAAGTDCAPGFCRATSGLPQGRPPDRTGLADGFTGVVPNPFAGSTSFHFRLSTSQRIRLEIFDASGRLVRSFTPDEVGAGERVVAWDGRKADGREAEAGAYLARLSVGGRNWARAVVRIR